MNCPKCGFDVSEAIGRAGGEARAAALTKKRRREIAAMGGIAQGLRSARAKAITRKLRSEAMKAAWARRKAG